MLWRHRLSNPSNDKGPTRRLNSSGFARWQWGRCCGVVHPTSRRACNSGIRPWPVRVGYCR
eukprot:4518700-Pyramimonas_sp.AAC.1